MNSKRFLIVLAILTIFAISAKAQVPPIEPTDTDNNGIRNVSTLNHLVWMNSNYNYCYRDSFELDNDIDASETVNWNSGTGFEPIGNYWILDFEGKFYGNNHSIDSLYINRIYMSHTGFIASSKGLLKDLSLTSCHIVGSQYVGALVGSNNGVIENCNSSGYVEGYNLGSNIGGLVGFNTGIITSSNSSADVIGGVNVGGLVGRNFTSYYTFPLAIISYCYSSGGVKGKNSVGGLIGWNSAPFDPNGIMISVVSKCYSISNVYGEKWVGGFLGLATHCSVIDNSYAMGRVTGLALYNGYGGFIGNNDYQGFVSNCYSQGAVVSSALFTGGFIGECYNSYNVTDCFWDVRTSGLTGGYPWGYYRTSTQMQDQLTFTNWDFTNVWEINPNENGKYPHLRDVAPVINVLEPEDTDSDGFKNIATLKNLRWVSEYSELCWTWNYELDGSLVAYPTNEWNFDTGFNPIGNLTTPYTGQFNGNNYYIDRLFINRPTDDYIGLFGYVSKGAQIRNLRLRVCDFTGQDYVGGLAGWVENDGNTPLLLLPIENCVTTGKVVGQRFVGGLVGKIYYSGADASSTYICRSASKCDVTGLATSNVNAGGLVGWTNATINNCYARGTVTGFDYTGGAIGRNEGPIEKCYSTGLVNSNNDYSGLIGSSIGSVNFCYWDITTSGKIFSSGGIGRFTNQMIIQSTFFGWDFINIWECIALENDNYPSFIGVPYYKMNSDNNEFKITSENIILDIFPNPVSSETYITINTDEDMFANIFIYNTLGQVVKSCYSGNISKGTKNLNLNLQDLNEGSYYLIIENNSVLSCKMIVISR